MSGSTHSLDETNSDSTKTIRKFTVTRHSPLGKAEWGSLPALSQAPSTAESVIRKTRRFSVSPSSSTFDITESSAEVKFHFLNLS
uniref:Uncharacterized protein n=1 Tax=Heterorhabditis bacteriophora TaxID=37862 RepID=A0A1I7WQF0_HETBA